MKRDWLAVWLGATALGVVLTAVAPTFVTVNYDPEPIHSLYWGGIAAFALASNLWFGKDARYCAAVLVAGASLNMGALALAGSITNFIPLGGEQRASVGDAMIILGEAGLLYCYLSFGMRWARHSTAHASVSRRRTTEGFPHKRQALWRRRPAR